MQASRWIAVWMAVGALGMTGTGAGCGGDESGDEPPASSASTTSTGEGSASSTGTGGHGGSGTGGHGGSGTGGHGGSGTGGNGGSGTGGDGGSMGQSFNLTLRGSGYVPAYDVGTDVYVEVIAVGESAATLSASDTIDEGGTFSVTGQVLGGKAYKMHWYADLVADGECNEGQDHVWTQDIPTVTADISRSVAPNTDFDTCP